MKMTRGWALVFGIILLAGGLMSAISRLMRGLRSGFGTPVAYSASSWHGNAMVTAVSSRRAYMLLREALAWSVATTVIGAATIAGCWLLARRDARRLEAAAVDERMDEPACRW